VLLVTVAADAPAQPPIARDDRVQAASLGRNATIEVAVLDNDEDPDGTADALKVSTDDPNAVVQPDGKLRVTLQPTSQVILYTVTDPDRLTASAFVWVPGTAGLLPTLKITGPLQVVSGKSLTIALADVVTVRPDRVPRIAVADSVRAGQANGSPFVVDAHTLQYTSRAGYYGPDSISVEVTDGTGPDDPQGNSAYVSIPILVLPATNQSPTLADTSIQVAPGEAAVELNLRKLARDPDPGDVAKLKFSVVSTTDGFEAKLDGDFLKVSARDSTKRGTIGKVVVKVDDGTSAATTGTISATVVASQRPLPVANDDVVPRADQGKPVVVDVLRNDYNPFPETPLTVFEPKVESGRGTATTDGTTVTVTPAGDFFGTMIIDYHVRDATAAPEREVQATITVTVQGRPDAPGTPVVTSVSDRAVVLSWQTPSNNGAQITGYTVKAVSGGTFTRACPTTTCTLDGLTNNVEYRFVVIATNSVDDSDPSPASAVARPDARPDKPSAPKLKFGDRSLTVSWTTPHSSGSPVESYTLEISPAPASGPIQLTGVTGTSVVWKGLANGTAYQVRVQAVNRAPDPSDWSAYSASEVPAAAPDAPGRPTTDAATPVGAQAQIKVAWTAPASDNGDKVADYTLTVKRGGSVIRTITTTATSQNVTVETSQTDYTFSVTARNKAGSSKTSGESEPRRGAIAPGAPTNVKIVPHDQSVALTFGAGAPNGNKASEITYHYRVDQTGASGTVGVGGGTIGGLTNGTSYTVSVWATSSVQGVSGSAETKSNAATPYGKPIIALVSVTRLDNAVRFTWTVKANGSLLQSPGYGVPTGGGTGTYTKTGMAAGSSTTLTVTFTNAAGQRLRRGPARPMTHPHR